MPGNDYSLKFTPEARDDLFEIFQYIAVVLAAPGAAETLIDKIEKDCRRLTLFPFSCPIPCDAALAKKGYRMLVVDNFIAFYQVDEATAIVRIMRVVYGKRNYRQLL
ncbi:MAG: type II toxin-antitoxin system RelE/ParE family toxin [Acidobacteriota bacterium]|jgi:addiction module RelE/StbE family toxin|nr:type II toxin-antitoxin system RelE/ParE family toxin [Acidobacteriota bacterium]